MSEYYFLIMAKDNIDFFIEKPYSSSVSEL